MNTAVITSDDALQKKFSALKDFLRPKLKEGLIVAFSGGVDSTFLLWTAEQERLASGGKLVALTTSSASFSQAERDDAEHFIKTHNIEHIWKESEELANPQYTINDSNRCYHCKTELFRICSELSQELNFKWIAYGYNADDRSDFRPGHKAALENQILSPLNDAQLSKEEIRSLMRLLGLEIADKPASPCLSSRLMTGVFVTPQKLKDVEDFEKILRNGGLKIFRVRLHEEGKKKFLRLEIAPDEMQLAIELREELVKESRSRGYQWITLDLAGYKTGGANLIER